MILPNSTGKTVSVGLLFTKNGRLKWASVVPLVVIDQK